MKPVAIVPAHNEEATVANVIGALLSAGCLDSVLVVNDGSTDRTAEVAEAAGAKVMSLKPNRGKGQAMIAAVSKMPPEYDIAFFDADLVGFTPAHARELCRLFALGFDMVCGLRDYGGMRNALQTIGPLITGERVLRRWVLDALPDTCWNGYRIETGMNDVVRRHGGRTCLTYMRGVGIRTKLDKTGFLKGLMGQLKMFAEIARTQESLEKSDGQACGI